MSILNALGGSSSSSSALGQSQSASHSISSSLGSGQWATSQSALAMEKANAWNERMFAEEKKYNAEQALLNRQFQEEMSNSAYQRAVTDMKAARINPILAYNQGGASQPSGSAASASSAGSAMSSAFTDYQSESESASESIYRMFAESQSNLMQGLEAIVGSLGNALSNINVNFGGLGNDLPSAAKQAADVAKDNLKGNQDKALVYTPGKGFSTERKNTILGVTFDPRNTNQIKGTTNLYNQNNVKYNYRAKGK